MPGVTGDGDRYLIRPATEDDLDAIAAFEVEIAVVSFGDEAITDAAFHRRRVANSLGKPGEIALVAVAADIKPPDPQPGRTDPPDPQPAHPDPACTHPAGTQPAGTQPPSTGPADAQPARTQPANPDPAYAEPASTPPTRPAPLGWAWMSARTNSLTGARYGNFRSLAVAEHPDQGIISQLLMTEILAAADEAGFTHLTGKVNAANHAMRALYRAFGFTATHLTMEKRTGS
jgi:hypothetical protein